MQIQSLPIAALPFEDLQIWSDLQRGDVALHSPFFRAEFIQAVAAVREDVEVAVLREGAETVGFWPYQRAAGGIGNPVGAGLSDYHGPILRAGFSIEPERVLEALGLRAWNFDHLPASMADFLPYHRRVSESPYLDLSQGYEGYRNARMPLRSDEISQSLRKSRKLGREIGTVHVEFHTTRQAVFEQLLAWKQQQYDRTGVPNVLARTWVIPLLERILKSNTPHFRPVLSALFAGDRLAAAHLGMISGTVLHYWFPAYDVELARYSPGSAILLHSAEACPEHGIQSIDLGKGPEQYKRRFMSGVHRVAEGFVDLRPIPRAVRGTWWRARNWVHTSRWRQPARRAWDRLQPVRAWLEPG
jgi:CelD/BcsL family acetyltransferase involved in cellulose biosynthesis